MPKIRCSECQEWFIGTELQEEFSTVAECQKCIDKMLQRYAKA